MMRFCRYFSFGGFTAVVLIAAAAAVVALPTMDASAETPAAKLVNPFTGNPDAIKEGRKLYLQNNCSGCHGVMGGGGMAIALLDETWKFGSGDEILFKLIKGEIPESTMPRVWNSLDADEVWKILAYVRSLYKGDPSTINW